MSALPSDTRNVDSLFKELLYNKYQEEICRRDADAVNAGVKGSHVAA